MKLTAAQLRRIIKEEVQKSLKNDATSAPVGGTGERIRQAFEKFVAMHPELMEDPDVAHGMENYGYTSSYSRASGANQLVLGSLEAEGGDAMYDAVVAAGLLDSLKKFVEKHVNSTGPATKRPRKFEVIPYSEYQWNEDKRGADL